ncbi:caffeic acid 3-O-methyltransferase 1-like [Cucumis melo var. makuwa]|uniref:Caffeic acid 3-O-methyltransferase 1-like n=1 Tax=Cucumis melo var. makuwa TaxID=1194695 RepID=A0A5A7VDM4_CUCMM|nr:caffeic acid 3-O-methyltransferase 1-like [Cucumis melo var. makuwa]
MRAGWLRQAAHACRTARLRSRLRYAGRVSFTRLWRHGRVGCWRRVRLGFSGLATGCDGKQSIGDSFQTEEIGRRWFELPRTARGLRSTSGSDRTSTAAVAKRLGSELKNAVIEGGGTTFTRAYGGIHAFEYLGKDSRFNIAMINHSTMPVKKILKAYKGFANIKQLVDVGGGLGITLQLITSIDPYIKGINYDLPHVIRDAPPYPGVEHVGGDMFEKIPNGDALILHDWSDEHCITLLKNCYNAIPDDGKVIVVDSILPTLPETTSATKAVAQCDMVEMTLYEGGKERTRDEFKALATKAGFKHVIFQCLVANLWVTEFLKN